MFKITYANSVEEDIFVQAGTLYFVDSEGGIRHCPDTADQLFLFLMFEAIAMKDFILFERSSEEYGEEAYIMMVQLEEDHEPIECRFLLKRSEETGPFKVFLAIGSETHDCLKDFHIADSEILITNIKLSEEYHVQLEATKTGLIIRDDNTVHAHSYSDAAQEDGEWLLSILSTILLERNFQADDYVVFKPAPNCLVEQVSDCWGNPTYVFPTVDAITQVESTLELTPRWNFLSNSYECLISFAGLTGLDFQEFV